MDTQAGQSSQSKPSWAGDLWGGLTAMLVALPSSIAFGVITYTVLGPEYAGMGAMTGMLGAAAIGLVAPFFGRTGGLISAPCAPSSAVLTAFIIGLVSGSSGAGLTPADVLPLLVITALLAALLQIIYGVLAIGKLIKFIPYPVVSGYLSGVAVLIAIGQLPKLLGLPKGVSLMQGLTSPGLWRREVMAIGIITICLMAVARRITTRLPAAIIGLAGGIAAYFIIAIFMPAMRSLDGNPLIIGRINAPGPFVETAAQRLASVFSIKTASLRLILVPGLTLSVLLSIDTLKTCVGLDALTRSRHNSNRELMGQGIANMASAIAGGMPGAGTMGPTLVNVSSGGRTFRSGVIEGIFVVLAVLLLGGLIAWVPIGALAGLLLAIAWRMFDKSIFRLLRYPAGRLDFAVIAGVIVVAITVDLIAASGVGVALAIILFIRDQIRNTVIRRKLYLNQISSKTRRIALEREALERDGGDGVFCELQGSLFFGTTDQLFSQLEPDLKKRRFILLDMRRVHSMDYTAAHLFEQMHAQLAERHGQLLLSGMPSSLMEERDFEKYLKELGVVRQGKGVMICETVDAGLEWMEERILETAGIKKTGGEERLNLPDFHLLREFDEATLNDLAACMTEITLAPGEKVVSQGDQGDEIFLVRRGSVNIMLQLDGGKRHHLATVSRGDFFGELSFLDRKVRSADVEAKAPTDLYVITRSRFNDKSRANAELGVKVFARLASAIAERLRQTDVELRALEER
ncbi:MAG: SLC26A/SulP transporter family protein [Deltaproteobacteria bacterium]|nr:SLC26A/SulP transporter family protein [Deltaproteobacteria bacterium]